MKDDSIVIIWGKQLEEGNLEKGWGNPKAYRMYHKIKNKLEGENVGC